MPEPSDDFTYHLLGVPLRTGSLYPGSENDAQAYRNVLNKQDVPAAYFPHADGLSLADARELLGPMLADRRIRTIEVTEYASLRDLDQSAISRLVELLATALKKPDH